MLELTDDEIEEMIKSHLLSLRAEKLSYSYVNLHFHVLKHFFRMNKRRINTDILSRYVGEFEIKYELESYTTDDIRSILAICSLKMKVAVFIMATTGIRVDALAELKIGDLKKIESEIGSLYEFTIYKNARERTFCFCTPECAAVIDSYLEYRRRAKEELLPYSPLIRSDFDLTDLDQVRENARPVSKSTLTNNLQLILVKSGIKEINHNAQKGQRHPKPINHAFRYWWMNEAMRTRMNPEIRQRLYSHDTGNLERRYWKNVNAQPELLEEYIRCVNSGAFSISEEAKLRRKVEMLTVEKSKVDQALADIEAMKQRLGLD
jgi:integrase